MQIEQEKRAGYGGDIRIVGGMRYVFRVNGKALQTGVILPEGDKVRCRRLPRLSEDDRETRERQNRSSSLGPRAAGAVGAGRRLR